MNSAGGLQGFITERHLDEADQAFPGIRDYYEALPAAERPATFLDLAWQFQTRGEGENN